MSTLTKAVSAQWPIAVDFEANFDDTMDNTSGVNLAIGAEDAADTTFAICTPPPGAVVVGGAVYTVAVFNSTANTLDLGDSDAPDRYTPTIHDLKSTTAHSVITPVGAVAKVYSGNQDIVAAILNTVTAATAGKFRIVIIMSMSGKATENLKTT